MPQKPESGKKQAGESPPREKAATKKSAGDEDGHLRLPIQAAPVRRTAGSVSPFLQESGRHALCHILSPYAASECRAVGGL